MATAPATAFAFAPVIAAEKPKPGPEAPAAADVRARERGGLSDAGPGGSRRGFGNGSALCHASAAFPMETPAPSVTVLV